MSIIQACEPTAVTCEPTPAHVAADLTTRRRFSAPELCPTLADFKSRLAADRALLERR